MTTATQNPLLEKRYEFVYFFDVTDGNPNGDPDAGNSPRIDPETGQGLVTDVCLKRKVRNYIQLTQGDGGALKPGYEIYVKERGILAREQQKAYKDLKKEPDGNPGTIKEARAWMCRNFYDVRAFGAVMSTGKAGDEDTQPKPAGRAAGGRNQSGDAASPTSGQPTPAARPAGPQKQWNCGQVRGPLQLSFARSIHPILALEHAITRVALTNPGDTKRGAATASGEEGEEATSGQMGRKTTIPYALYRAHGFVSPFLARDTGFTAADLELFWKALTNMFEYDRSASRGIMSARALIVFEHESTLGNAPAHSLFERVRCERTKEKDPKLPARAFSDYTIKVDEVPVEGVTVIRKI